MKLGIKKRSVFLLISILQVFSTSAAIFYTGNEIPEFNESETNIFREFGISFKTLKQSTKIATHNKEVLEIIEVHGNHWRDSLLVLLVNEREPIKKFIRYLSSNTGFDLSDKKHVLIVYHWNGIIAKRQVTISLSGERGGMYHRRINTQFWGKKGEKLRSESKVERGSGL